jgi:hypothetical protein
MAISIDLTGITSNPVEVAEIKDFIIERVFERVSFESIHGPWETEIKMQKQIQFVSQFGKTGVKSDTTCDRKTSSPVATATQKYWNPSGIEDTLINCAAELDKLWKMYFSKIKAYRENYDIEGTDLEMLFIVLLEDSMVATIWRTAWFSDLNVAAAAAGTAGLVDGVNDVKFYDYIDGLWAQIFDGVAALNITRVTITENTVITSKDNQLALAAGAAKAYFRAVKNASDSRLRSDPNAQMLVSRELFDNYKEGLEDAGTPFDVTLTTDGLQQIKIDGYTIVNMETIWNLSSREDFVNNTTDNVYDLPHRIVFTIPTNIPLGTLSEGDFDELEIFWDKVTRKNYMAYGFSMDAKLLEEYMITVAY